MTSWLPSVLIVTPLIGFSFQADERRAIFFHAAQFDGNPIHPAQAAIGNVIVFLMNSGNFRPMGRFADYW
ncbi:hypothetical protein OAM92_01460 [Acidimicrobiales bacterium]|jgi:hypothetical protein|nr:hypothetical protein [Acidimicrobiales bacterium]